MLVAMRILARWRRRGKGVWYVTLIVEGDDEVYKLVYPGRLSRTFVKVLARMELAKALGEKRKHVHVTEMRKES